MYTQIDVTDRDAVLALPPTETFTPWQAAVRAHATAIAARAAAAEQIAAGWLFIIDKEVRVGDTFRLHGADLVATEIVIDEDDPYLSAEAIRAELAPFDESAWPTFFRTDGDR